MAYPTLTEIKARLAITGTAQDDLLQHSLNVARGAVESYCGYRWGLVDSEARLFQRSYYSGRKSVFDVSDPGLLSYTDLTVSRGGTERTPRDDDVLLVRYSRTGTGPWDLFRVNGDWDEVSIRGIWGQGTEPPSEVAEAVMIVAMGVFTEGYRVGSGGEASDATLDIGSGLVGFLLSGHRRAR